MDRLCTWSFYDPATGELTGRTFSGPESLLEVNTPNGHAAVEGCHDRLARRVDLATGDVVPWQPPQPTADHEWHAELERWVLNAAAVKRLGTLDRIVELERSQHRAMREAVLGSATARDRLLEIDQAIAALRSQLL